MRDRRCQGHFVFKEVKFNNAPEATVYDNIRNKLGHDTEESTITLLKDFADLEIRDSESQPPNADANQRVALQNTEQLHLIPSKLLFPHRIQIMQMLTSNESVKFKQIGEATGLSNGNLWSHIRALEADGLMAINKEVNGRKVKL